MTDIKPLWCPSCSQEAEHRGPQAARRPALPLGSQARIIGTGPRWCNPKEKTAPCAVCIIIYSVPPRVILRRVRCPSLSIRHSGALNRTGRGQDSDSLILKVYSASPGRRRTAADTGFARGGWSEEPARSVQPLPRVETGSLTASEAPNTSYPPVERVTRLLHRPGPLNHLLPSGKGSDGTPGSED